MDISLRRESPADHRAVEELTREAFWNLHVPGCDEHYLVHRMRNHPDFVPGLDFVAVDGEGRIVGNIMYTRSRLEDGTGVPLETLTFGPIAVLPGFQRRGVGTALIGRTRELALAMGCPAIVILGDYHNYVKHGFRSCVDLGVADGEGRHPLGLLVLELRAGALAGRSWRARFSPVYELDPAAVAAFDAGFSPKEKAWAYSQEEFSIAVRAEVAARGG